MELNSESLSIDDYWNELNWLLELLYVIGWNGMLVDER